MVNSAEEKIKLYLAGAKNYFKDIKVVSQFSLYSSDSPQNAEVTFNNKVIDYQIPNNNPLQIIHYTNIQSYCNIINSQLIRLYDCNNLNDSREIELGLKRIGFQTEEKWIEDLKRFHFIFSASEYKGKDDFNMWRLYGDNGFGVALVFEIDENFQKWNGIHLSKVSYSEEDNNLHLIKEFIKFHNEFQEKNKLFIKVPSLIPLLSAFQKNDIWSIEREFRLVATCIYDKNNLRAKSSMLESINPFLKNTLTQSVNNAGKLVSYLELPITEKYIENRLKKETDENIINTLKEFHPRLKLKKVIFGHNLIGTKKGESLLEYSYNNIPSKINDNVKLENSQF
jgi:hypothetical protein